MQSLLAINSCPLQVGGRDHTTGQPDEGDPWADLEAYGRTHWPQAKEVLYRWSGQVRVRGRICHLRRDLNLAAPDWRVYVGHLLSSSTAGTLQFSSNFMYNSCAWDHVALRCMSPWMSWACTGWSLQSLPMRLTGPSVLAVAT
jgi:hypothetical protein